MKKNQKKGKGKNNSDAESAKEQESLLSNQSTNDEQNGTSQSTVSSDIAKQAFEMMAIPIQEYDKLIKELEEARQSTSENFEGWQRERADFANFRKRVERDNAKLVSVITGNIIKKYLTIEDDLERALKNRPTEGEEAYWADGIDLIYRKLHNILEGEGIIRIPAETETFDPNRHEAISHEDNSNYESGQIIEVIQQGYMLGDWVIRPALVRVAK